MDMKLMLGTAVSALALSAAVASAATFSFGQATPAEIQARSTTLPPAGQTAIQESFAGAATQGGNRVGVVDAAQDRTAGNTFTSAVGTFAGLGGAGNGGTVTGNRDQIQIRSGDNGGRFNVLAPGGNFLDSNDTLGFSWTIANSPLLRSASAFITDPNDNRRELTVSLLVDGVLKDDFHIAGGRNNRSVWFLETDFATYDMGWETATFEFRMSGTNDGIGISNATLNVIPLPAPALLLLSGMGTLGGLSVLRRRRRTA